MPIARFQMPDGRVARFEVPDGTTPEQATTMMQAHFNPTDAPAPQVPQAPSGFDEAKAGLASGPINAYLALKQLLPGGLSSEDQNVLQQNNEAAKKAPWSSFAGNALMFAPTAMIPGANTMTGAATIGAVGNALTTVGGVKDRAIAAGLGAAGGVIGNKLSSLVGGATPSAVNPNVQLLAKEGVSMTPGQNAGGFLKSFEDKATSMPIVGNIINNARRGGIEDFNRAAINRAKLPGMQVDGVGNQAMQDLRQGLGSAYDDVLSRSTADTLDPTYVQSMQSLRNLVSSLPEKEQKAFDNIIAREVGDRVTPNGTVFGQNLQDLNSGMGRQAKNFSTSTDGYQRQLGDALKQADAEFRDLITRTNPQNAGELKAVNTAYANFKRLQRASSGVGADEGVFTPAQLHNAVRALDSSKDKRAFSEGGALLQDLTTAGKSVLPSKIPDSGTAGRIMNNLFSLSGLASTAGGVAASIPALAAYSRPGSAAINGAVNGSIPVRNALLKLFQSNPELIQTLGITLPKLVGN